VEPEVERDADAGGTWQWDGKRWVIVPGRYPVEDARVAAYQTCRATVAHIVGDIRHAITRCLPHESNPECAAMTTKALDDVETSVSQCAGGGGGASCVDNVSAAVRNAIAPSADCETSCDSVELTHIAQNVVDRRGEPPRCGGVMQVALSWSGFVVIDRVMPGGPASFANLLAGDRVMAVNGTPAASVTAVVMALESTVPGDAVQIQFMRNGVRQQTQATTVSASAQVNADLRAP
jgi:membrane-associated protease RseP (regulator of RpoE activity)